MRELPQDYILNRLNEKFGVNTNSKSDGVSLNDINSLLKGKNKKQITTSNTEKLVFDKNDEKELEDFCKKHGIMGVDFGNKNPKQILEMLKRHMGLSNEKFL